MPANCGWQELKDFVRANDVSHVKQAHIHKDHVENPDGIGTIIISSKEEAIRAFSMGYDKRAVLFFGLIHEMLGDPSLFWWLTTYNA